MSDVVRPCPGFGELCFIHLGVKRTDRWNILGPDWGQSLAISGAVKVFGSYSSASWGEVGGSWGQAGLSAGHVEAKLGHVMLCWSYMSDFVGFASGNAFPQQDQDFKFHLGSSKATLWLRWCHLGASFGDFGAVLKALWFHFGTCCFGIVKSSPQIHLRNAPPWPWRRNLPKPTFKTLSPVALQPQPLPWLAK